MCTTNKGDFYAGFPNVLGAVDGTNITLQAPNLDEASFVNRKNFHSINVQGICDASGIFCLLWSLATSNFAWNGAIIHTQRISVLESEVQFWTSPINIYSLFELFKSWNEDKLEGTCWPIDLIFNWAAPSPLESIGHPLTANANNVNNYGKTGSVRDHPFQ